MHRLPSSLAPRWYHDAEGDTVIGAVGDTASAHLVCEREIGAPPTTVRLRASAFVFATAPAQMSIPEQKNSRVPATSKGNY